MLRQRGERIGGHAGGSQFGGLWIVQKNSGRLPWVSGVLDTVIIFSGSSAEAGVRVKAPSVSGLIGTGRSQCGPTETKTAEPQHQNNKRLKVIDYRAISMKRFQSQDLLNCQPPTPPNHHHSPIKYYIFTTILHEIFCLPRETQNTPLAVFCWENVALLRGACHMTNGVAQRTEKLDNTIVVATVHPLPTLVQTFQGCSQKIPLQLSFFIPQEEVKDVGEVSSHQLFWWVGNLAVCWLGDHSNLTDPPIE